MSKIVFCVELGQPIPLKTFKIVRALSLLEYIFPSPVLSGTFEKEFFTQAIIYGVEKSFSLKGDDIRHYLEPGEIMVAAFQEDGTKLLLLRRSIRESLSGSMFYRYLFDEAEELLDISTIMR